MSQPPERPPEWTPPGPSGDGVPPAAPGQYPPAQKPSSKKNVGPIIGLIAAGVLALSAIIIGVVVLVSGDDEPTASAPSSSESTNPSPDAGEDPTDDTGRLTGEGYSYELPDEWQDVSEDVIAQNPPGAIDTVATWGPDIESGRANLIVERQPAEVTDPEELRENWQSNLGNAVGVTPKPGPDSQIDGEKVIAATLDSVNSQDVSVAQTAYLTVVDGAVYSITLSAEKGDAGAKDVFDEILDSWTWE